MQPSDAQYGLGVRLAHLTSILVLALLLATGARLAWFGQTFFSYETARLVDALAPAGQVHKLHQTLGIVFAAIGVFYVVYLLTSGEAPRLFALFRDRRYSSSKKFIYLLVMVIGLTSFLSGVTLHSGLYSGSAGHVFMKTLHYYCALALVVFTVAHVIDVVVSLRTKANVIFLARPRKGFFGVRALGLAALMAITAGLAADRYLDLPRTLHCRERHRLITVDGYERDLEWADIDSLVFYSSGGVNFHHGVSRIVVKTFRSRYHLYLLVKWYDRTRSYNRHLIKTRAGWVEQVSEYADPFGESIYAEDKLALAFHRNPDGCRSSCHVRTPGKTGLHYTDGDTADVWVWMAVSTDPARGADDRWWAGYENDLTGGRHYDNIAGGGYRSNLNREWCQPYFLPQHAAMRYWIPYEPEEFVPYDTRLDTFSLGARVPAVLVAPISGDRGDVRARGHWRNGVWTVEFTRRLRTGSPYDVSFPGQFFLGIAPFDNADSKHAYHLKPIRLVAE